MIMKPKLELKEWESTKRLAEAGIKDAQMSMIVNKMILNRANREISKLGVKTPSSGEEESKD